MRYDYTDIYALQLRARRERAEAVYRLLIAPVVAYFTSPPAQEPCHAPRPHLARQG